MMFEEKRDNKEDVTVSVDVNFLHNFEVCWNNNDSEEKRINFSYKHKTNLPLMAKDVEDHMKLIDMFQQRSDYIKGEIFEEKELQDKYFDLLNDHEIDIKQLFAFKIGILLFIILMQVWMLTRLVDSNVSEIKTIVIGPH